MGKGGKRWGAGRPGWHVKAEDCRSIDVRRWHRDGLLTPGASGLWSWTSANTGAMTTGAAYVTTDKTVMLGTIAPDGTPVQQQAPILRTPCHFGGDRLWFGCPHCARRVAVLFHRPAIGFACRRCAVVAYTSQSEDVMARAWRQQGKVERQLGACMSRPTGMHRTTHDRLLAKVYRCEEQRLAALIAWQASRQRGGVPT